MLDRGHRLSPREAGTARDSVAEPGTSGDGAGCFPRWTDYHFFGWFSATINFHPFLVLIALLFPFLGVIELFFSPVLRASFCLPSKGYSSA